MIDMDVSLTFDGRLSQEPIVLPASKSISNRVLIINALADSVLPVHNLSDCDDTRSMLKVLNSEGNRFDIGHAGTAMRFLTAFLARIVGVWEITGSERMKQRPVKVLVDALNRLGAHIQYTEKEGFPPLRIYGSYLQGGKVQVPASVSSQYISALMMIAPYMADGLILTLTGKIVSQAYIRMTASLMQEFGAEVKIEGNEIRVMPVPYKSVPYTVEADWSAASYFYEWLTIAGRRQIVLHGLKFPGIQGDAHQIEVWKKMGITTSFENDETILKIKEVDNDRLEYNFVEMPDLVQSFAVACCLLKKPFIFSGVETLRIKETDRIAALMNELKKLGFELEAEGDNLLMWRGKYVPEGEMTIATYHDHRMAMAFAPAALHFPGLVIQDSDVVSKSFPAYWKQLEKLGAVLHFC